MNDKDKYRLATPISEAPFPPGANPPDPPLNGGLKDLVNYFYWHRHTVASWWHELPWRRK